MKLTIKSIITIFAVFFAFTSVGWSQVKTVSSVDLNKYLGLWYEVASIPQSFQRQCALNTTAQYSLEGDLIKVINSCQTEEGEMSVAEGRAKVVDTATNSKLKVTFVKLFDWVFAFGGNYWILEIGPNYSYALVGDPSAEYAWILSRKPKMSLKDLRKAEKTFRSQGYNTCEILTSIQDKGNTEQRTPLCRLAN